MIRKYLFLFVIVLPFLSFAQNYQLLNENSVRIFSYAQYYKGFRIDSVARSGSDSIFYINKVSDIANSIWGPTPECSVYKPAFIGDKMVKRGAMNILLTQNGDSVYFKTNALLGQSWQLANVNSILYTATVTSFDTVTINGIPDSLMVMTIVSSDNWSGLQVKLSKSNGIYYAFSFSEFPGLSDGLTLISYSMLKYSDVFDFNIGDGFYYEFMKMVNSSYPPSYSRWEVISKSLLTDSVKYSFVRYHNEIQVDYSTNPPTVTNIYSTDTISQTYRITNDLIHHGSVPEEAYVYPGFDLSSYIIGRSNLINSPVIQFEERNSGFFFCLDTITDNMTSCPGHCFALEFEPDWVNYKYYKGLDMTVSYEEPASFYYYRQILLGYKKAGVYYGDYPTNVEQIPNDHFTVYPVPASTELRVNSLKGDIFIIRDLSGKKVHSGIITDVIDISFLKDGLYLFQTGSGSVKKIVVKK